MGQITAHLWEREAPEPKRFMRPLRGWTREDLISLCNNLKVQSVQSMDHTMFRTNLRFEIAEDAEQAFSELKSKCGRVELLMVIGPMIVMSDQAYASKVSLLFSVFDLNSDGCINRAETFIALRMLFLGVDRVFKNPSMPDDFFGALEEDTEDLFKRLDRDHSGDIHIGDILSFAYRSHEVKSFLSPFLASDQRLFEDLVIFSKGSKAASRELMKRNTSGLSSPAAGARASASNPKRLQSFRSSNSLSRRALTMNESALRTQEVSYAAELKHQLRITPDESNHDARDRRSRRFRVDRSWRKPKPGRQPTCITKEHAWVVWSLFNTLARGRRLIPKYELKQAFEDNNEVMARLKKHALMEPDAPEEEAMLSVASRFTTADALRRVSQLGEDIVSLRAFLCFAWPLAPEMEVELCMRWCRAFRANEVINDIIAKDTTINHPEQIEALLEAVDTNGDSLLATSQLCGREHQVLHQARKLLAKWDRDEDKMPNRQDINTILRGMSAAIQVNFQEVFRHIPVAEQHT